VIALGRVKVSGFKWLGKVVLFVYGGLVSFIGVEGRIIVMAIDDTLTRFAYTEIPRLAEHFPGNQRGAFRVKDLAAGAAVMLSPKGREGVAAIETVLGVFVSHPKLPS
jgi:hypothetical protein